VNSFSASLPKIIGGTRHILLDFDGSICSIFDGVTAQAVADQLRRRLGAAGFELPGDTFGAGDPLDVLRDAWTLGRRAADRAQRVLTDLEIEAVRSARPTPGAAGLITAADQTGRTVTIVSNNSPEAIVEYLVSHDVPAHIRTIYGRDDADTAHLKPHPYRIHKAITGLGAFASPGHCAMIGDSPSDVTAARRARVAVIGYASRPGQRELLAGAGPDAIIANLAEITAALRSTPIAE
jgi:phosphoglycolate phosphatase